MTRRHRANGSRHPRRPPAAYRLALACCCLLAGCAGVGPATPGGPDTGATGTATVTPAPVPESGPDAPGRGADTTTADAAGADTRGVVDADAIVAAHRGALANQSVRVDALYLVRYRNGTVRRYERTTGTLAADRSRFYLPTDRYTPATAPGGTHHSVWSNGSAVLVMRIQGGETTYAGRRGHETRTPRSLSRLDLRGLLGAARGVTVESTDAGRRLSGTVPAAALSGMPRPATGDATFVVGLDGTLVREVRLSYPARADGTPVTVEHWLHHDRVGTAEVYRPFWVETAARTLDDGGG